jgi:hypothetical protein
MGGPVRQPEGLRLFDQLLIALWLLSTVSLAKPGAHPFITTLDEYTGYAVYSLSILGRPMPIVSSLAGT